MIDSIYNYFFGGWVGSTYFTEIGSNLVTNRSERREKKIPFLSNFLPQVTFRQTAVPPVIKISVDISMKRSSFALKSKSCVSALLFL